MYHFQTNITEDNLRIDWIKLNFIDIQTHIYYIKCHLSLYELHVFCSERTYSAINLTCFV